MRVWISPNRTLPIGAALLLVSTAIGSFCLFTGRHGFVVAIALVQGAIYAVAAYAIWRSRRDLSAAEARRALILILGVAIALRALLAFAPPHSTDIYRYVWDGRVQGSGINPYIYVPADPALAALRDYAIYPNINRREYAPTIYPPMAQAVYFIATRFSESVTAMKLAMLAFEGIAIWAVLGLLRARGLSPALIGIYAWHPLPLWEVAGSGHIDIVAVAFIWVAFLAAERGWRFAAGIALAAGAMTKYFPLALTPALYRRWDWKMPVAFGAAAAAIYLPYVSAGKKIFGFLGGYAGEELSGGDGFYIAAVLKSAGLGSLALPVFLVLAALILGALAISTGFRNDPAKPDLYGGFLIAVAFTVLFSPHYCWYFVWLIPFLCFYPHPSAFWLTLSATALYRVGWPPSILGASVMYVPFALLLILENLKRFQPEEAPHGRALA